MLAHAPPSEKRLHELLDQTALYTEFLNQAAAKPVAKRRKDDDTSLFNSLISGGTLRTYQVDGVRWLVSLYENGLNGILADEMGLGKTIMMITFIAHLRAHDVKGPIMIAAPLSTIPQWKAEFDKWAPSINTVVYYGTPDERSDLRRKYLSPKKRRRLSKNSGANKQQQRKQPSVVIFVSYGIVMRDRTHLEDLRWKYIVVDEGHRLKNFECRFLKDLKQLHSDNRLILTGTPLQNNLKELWSLLNFLLPDVFDSWNKFENWFDFDTRDTWQTKSGIRGLMDREKQNQIVSKLHGILRPFILRRVKIDVLTDLPKKREVVLMTRLTQVQRFYYELVFRKAFHLCPSTVRLQQNRVMQLRKVCNHPYLIEDSSLTNEQLVTCCGKLQMLDQLLTELKSRGHRVLLFSQMTSVLDILEDYMTLRSYKYRRFDGSTSSDDRQVEVKEFNTDPENFVFLLSTRSGGLGINLVSADTVIIYDSDWNPTQDQQAQDRCHRIGQKKDVLVIRLITAQINDTMKSVELSMLSRAVSKKRLHQLIIGKGKLLGLSANTGTTTHNDRWNGTVQPLDVNQVEKELLKDVLLHNNSSSMVQNDAQVDGETFMIQPDWTLETWRNFVKPETRVDLSTFGLPPQVLNCVLDRSNDTFTPTGLDQLDDTLGDRGFVVREQDVLADVFKDDTDDEDDLAAMATD